MVKVIFLYEKEKYNTKKCYLKCYLANVRSIKNKLDLLHELLTNNYYEIIILTETWFKNSIPEALITQNTNYNIERSDRSYSTGGGVAILVKNCITMSSVVIPDLISNSINILFEITCVV